MSTTDNENRHRTIVSSVQRMLETFDAWQQDAATFAIKPHGAMDRVIEACILTTCYGDIPEQSRGLEIAVGRLRLAYEDYQGGGYRDKTKEPLPSFYAAMRAVSDALKAIKVESQSIVIESVAELRRQGLNDEQIARAYGAFDEDRNLWVGPFFDGFGRSIPERIASEIASPKSVLGGDFIHPLARIEDVQRERRLADQARRFEERVETSKSEEARKIKPKPTRETVLQLLAEKLFPKQIMLDYDITEAEIDAIAMGAGIAVEAVPTEQPKPQSELQPEASATPSTESLSDRIKARTAAILAEQPEATSTEIAALLTTEVGQQVKPASVNAFMTIIKRQRQSA